VQFCRACNCIGNARTNILRADVPFEFRLLHQLSGLFACAAEQKLATRCMNSIRQFANCTEAGGVNCGHVAQTQNHDWRQRIELFQNVRELVRRAEKKWPVYAVHYGVVRNILTLQNMHSAVCDVIARHASDGRRTRDLSDES